MTRRPSIPVEAHEVCASRSSSSVPVEAVPVVPTSVVPIPLSVVPTSTREAANPEGGSRTTASNYTSVPTTHYALKN
jgi:hypothetical protein